MVSGWSAPRPGRFTPGKDPVPNLQEAGWAPGPVWTVQKVTKVHLSYKIMIREPRSVAPRAKVGLDTGHTDGGIPRVSSGPSEKKKAEKTPRSVYDIVPPGRFQFVIHKSPNCT